MTGVMGDIPHGALTAGQFDHRLATPDRRVNRIQRSGQARYEYIICDISKSDPNDGGPVCTHSPRHDEILVLGDERSIAFGGCCPYSLIGGRA